MPAITCRYQFLVTNRADPNCCLRRDLAIDLNERRNGRQFIAVAGLHESLFEKCLKRNILRKSRRCQENQPKEKGG